MSESAKTEAPRRRRKAEAPPTEVPPVEAPLEAEPEAEDAPHYHGHRDRLRQRFLTNGPDSFQDYELLELLLFTVIPRQDVKPLAKELLKAFGSLWSVVHAPPERLRRVRNFSDANIVAITIVGAAALRMTRQEVMNRPLLNSWQRLIDYCQGAMADEPNELFRLLFLDKRNVLIADEVQQRGTVDHTPVYPREVVKRALELGATALILVHNHPSGDPAPSRADIAMTREVIRVAAALGVTVHDHIVIGKGTYASFKTLGLL